jgi:hypothetical protein
MFSGVGDATYRSMAKSDPPKSVVAMNAATNSQRRGRLGMRRTSHAEMKPKPIPHPTPTTAPMMGGDRAA